jgi:glycerol dehydrogenase
MWGNIMDISDAYLPWDVFAPAGTPKPRVFIAPQRYIQGKGVLAHVGRYLSLVKARHVALLISERGLKTDGVVVLESLGSAGIGVEVSLFGGECSIEEITRHVSRLDAAGIDCLLAVGGGKCVDAGKAIAFRLDVPVVIVPTLASNDAPCSALSVLYTPDGISIGGEFYPCSPAMVIVDTAIVAAAPERYLVAGMGDAMATWYEARVCMENENAITAVGARPTLASCAIGEVCAHTLFSDGVAAAKAVSRYDVDGALEKVVEANTLLSGLGFESGGLAAAHALAQSYTGIARVRDNFLHGEMVAMGTLAQLVMEGRTDEAERVATFFAQVGLPVHLGQLTVDPDNAADLDTIAAGALGFPFIGNMPMPVDAALVKAAVLAAHALGIRVTAVVGDAAFRRLQAD